MKYKIHFEHEGLLLCGIRSYIGEKNITKDKDKVTCYSGLNILNRRKQEE